MERSGMNILLKADVRQTKSYPSNNLVFCED